MIYLLGTTHQNQHQLGTKQSRLFEKFLKKTIDTYHIDLLAEEWSTDASKRRAIEETLAAQVAKELGIKYLEFDPSKAEYKQLGYLGTSFSPDLDDPNFITKKKMELQTFNLEKFHLRENYWLDKIKKVNYTNMLFICGEGHLSEIDKSLWNNLLPQYQPDGIDSKLKKAGIEFEILKSDTYIKSTVLK